MVNIRDLAEVCIVTLYGDMLGHLYANQNAKNMSGGMGIRCYISHSKWYRIF